MRILLIGEYSNVHWTLAEGLRLLGHEVTVLSNGDFWKDYPRDIDLVRKKRKWGGIAYIMKLLTILPKLRNYDVVQLINPMFLEIKAHRIMPVYRYLRKYNKKMFLGAFGMDYYWVNECRTRKPLRYSDFNIGDELRTNDDALKETKDWIGTDKEQLNKMIAGDCDGIVAGLYEYYVCYQPHYAAKTTFIPYPIHSSNHDGRLQRNHDKMRVFIGINKKRNAYKGTDIMLRAVQRLADKYSDEMELICVESVPFAQYQQLMNGSDMLLDQLYSYTPSMNALLAMSKGIVCVGGGEPENYAVIDENELHPIVNVLPNEESVYQELERMILHPEQVKKLQQQSIEYISRHHDYVKVAQKYIDFWTLNR